MGEPILRAETLTKTYGAFAAVKGVSLDLAPGEVVTLLGPSGCGKTTTLRLLAGLERGGGGEIYGPNNRVLASSKRNIFVPPHLRNMGMVFQSYAVWPHMTVFNNVAYPLKVRRMGKRQIDERVNQVLETVGLSGLGDRPAPLLSGGQQQRVALARALVAEPDLLLLDEPFSNLDAGLRERMRYEMSELQRRFGLSIILVTHDQIEALSLSDRIVVMNRGVVEQIGRPKELYLNPATSFVRDFLGRTVVLEGSVTQCQPDGAVGFAIKGYSGPPLEARLAHGETIREGMDARLAIRPEDIETRAAKTRDAGRTPQANTIQGVIDSLLFVGSRNESRIALEGGQSLPLYLSRTDDWQKGGWVELVLHPDKTSVWLV